MIRVFIAITDPWELGERLGWTRLGGELERTVDDETGERGLVRLDVPIVQGDRAYRYVVASPRHEGRSLAELVLGKSVLCGIVGIPDDEARDFEALATKRWGAGVAFIGTIEPAPAPLTMTPK